MLIRKLAAWFAALVITGAASWIFIASSKTRPANVKIEIEPAIAKTQAHLLKNSDSISSYQHLLLDFLHRKFNLDEMFSAQKTPIKLTDDISPEEFRLLERIAYPEKLVTTLPDPTQIGPISYLTAAAANCDHILSPDNLSKIMQSNINSGGYGLTHVLLSLELMKENNCRLLIDNSLQEQVVVQVTALAGDQTLSTDLRLEAIAILLFTGHRNVVSPSWISWMISQQNEDGAWNADKGSLSDHSTVLALWALLEYSRPDAPDEPMIRRPGSDRSSQTETTQTKNQSNPGVTINTGR